MIYVDGEQCTEIVKDGKLVGCRGKGGRDAECIGKGFDNFCPFWCNKCQRCIKRI